MDKAISDYGFGQLLEMFNIHQINDIGFKLLKLSVSNTEQFFDHLVQFEWEIYSSTESYEEYIKNSVSLYFYVQMYKEQSNDTVYLSRISLRK